MCKKSGLGYVAIISISTLLFCFTCLVTAFSQTPRVVTELKSGWFFIKKDLPNAADNSLNEKDWQKVTIPHDWAISGPFSEENDLQKVQITEDGEQKASVKSGRTGGLPYIGIGWYRKHINISNANKNKKFYLEFDGAMSNAKVYVNNRFVGEWPYGYSSLTLILPHLLNMEQII